MKRDKTKSQLLLFIPVIVIVVLAADTMRISSRNKELIRISTDNNTLCEQRAAELETNYMESIGVLQRQLLDLNHTTSLNTETDKYANDDSTPDPTRPVPASHDETLDERVHRKYRFLFSRLTLNSADKVELQQLLIQRERVALLKQDAETYEEIASEVDPRQLQVELSGIDGQVQTLLSPEHYALYKQLKDSDREQYIFTQYVLGVEALFALSADQQEKLLLAKLKHKEIYNNTIARLGIYEDYPLTAAERNNLYNQAEAAIAGYRNNFLNEVKPVLTAGDPPMDQFTLLQNYENNNFEDELARLKGIIDRRQ